MNSLLEQELPGTADPRDQMLDLLTDDDLAYKLPGNNSTLGELCAEIGYMQQAYTQSFNTFTLDWSYRASQPDTITVAGFRAWYAKLDAEMVEALRQFSEDDVHTKQVDRGRGFLATLYVQFQIYREALLIFYGKASVYLKALEKELPAEWIFAIG